VRGEVKSILVEIYDRDGNLLTRIETNRDLFEEYTKRRNSWTRWAVNFLQALLANLGKEGASSFPFVDVNGTSRNQKVKADFATNFSFFNTDTCPNRLFISVGSSNTPVSATDYKLGAKIAESLVSVSVYELIDTLVLSASFSFTTETTICEVGLEWEGCVDGYSTCGRFLFDRTVLSPCYTVPAGGSVIVAYRIAP